MRGREGVNNSIIFTEMKPPELVRGQATALPAKNQHTTGEPAGSVAVEGARSRFVPQQAPGGSIHVPSPAVASLLQVGHTTVNVHGITVQHCRVFVPRCWPTLARG